MGDSKVINSDLPTKIYSDADFDRLIGGRYKILELIAQGGMGNLYRALDTNLQREVALKQLHPHYSSDVMFRQRFYREAKAMARLNHEAIIQVFDFSNSEESLYLVMEYFPERDLKHWIALKQGFPIQEVLNIAITIGSALVCAHEGGVCHRDIKPANILYSQTRGAKLTDFGIASAAGDQTLTRVGDVMGSPTYMSPEQAAGLTLDGRSDLFSLGITMFELMTGSEPYQAMTTTAIGAQLVYGTNEIELKYPRDTPKPMIRLIKSVVRRNPSDRLQDARAFCELVKDTASALDIDLGTKTAIPFPDAPPPPRGSEPPGKRRGIVVVIGLALFVIIGVAVWWIQLPKPVTSPVALTPADGTPPAGVEPAKSVQDGTSASIQPAELEKHKEVASQIRRTVVKALSEVESARKTAIDSANKIFPDDQWRNLQADHTSTLLEADQASELFKTEKYATAQVGFEKALEQIPSLVDRWNSLRKEAEKALTARQEDAERQRQAVAATKEKERRRLAAIEAEKAQEEATRRARHNELTKDDINEVRRRLTYLQQAFQNKDLLALQTLSELDEGHARFFQKLFNIYRQVRAELVVSKIDKDLAVGKITITSLVNQDGNRVDPGATWRTQTIRVPRVDAKWKTPVWQ